MSEPPLPLPYRIRRYIGPLLSAGERYALKGRGDPEYELGEVEEHRTRITPLAPGGVMGWHHALAVEDQMFSDQITRLIQRACAYFYEPDGTYEPMDGVADITVVDAEVERRITQLDNGELKREAQRTAKERYPLVDLPWDQQRALIEQIDALARRFGFEKVAVVEQGVGDE